MLLAGVLGFRNFLGFGFARSQARVLTVAAMPVWLSSSNEMKAIAKRMSAGCCLNIKLLDLSPEFTPN